MQRVELAKSGVMVANEDQPKGVQARAYVRPEVVTMSNVDAAIRGGGGYYNDGINLGKTDRT